MSLCRVFERYSDRDELATLGFICTTTFLRILVLIAACVLALPSLATSCIWGSLEESFTKADVVVKAKLRLGTTNFVSRGTSNQLGETEELFKQDKVSIVDVSKVWKGEDTNSLTVHSVTGSTLGYTIPENKTMVLFASCGKRTTTHKSPKEATEEKERPPLYTWYCSNNVELSGDASSQSIEQKLDRLQEKAEEAHKVQEHRKVLRERIRAILKSSADTQSKFDS